MFKTRCFCNKSKIFVIISRCYGSCENIRVVIFGKRLHSPLFRNINKRFHNTYQCGYIVHGWMPYSHLPRWPHGCMMKGSLCHVRLCLISRATTAIKARKIIRSLTWDTDPSSYSHVVMWGKWLYGIQPWSISCCPVREGGNGVDFRPESRLMTLRDLKQENYVKCIKYKLIL